MSQAITRRPPRLGLAAAILAVSFLAMPSFAANRRTPGHGHHDRRVKAVIVIGKPRPVKTAVVVHGRPAGILDLNVKPKDTLVWVDGTLRGTVARFDGHPDKLHLIAGNHRVKLITPDGIEVARDIRVRAGIEVDVRLDLR